MVDSLLQLSNHAIVLSTFLGAVIDVFAPIVFSQTHLKLTCCLLKAYPCNVFSLDPDDGLVPKHTLWTWFNKIVLKRVFFLV